MTDCTYCQREMDAPGTKSLLEQTADHVMPGWLRREVLYERTINELYETVPCCWHCNNLKGQMSPGQWEQFMADNPRWWEKPEHRRRRGDKPQSRISRATDTPWMRQALASWEQPKK